MVESNFVAPAWLRDPHLQTLYPVGFRTRPDLSLRRERLELADGDFLDIAYGGPETGPILLMFHGLEGSLNSHYARPWMQTFHEAGWRTAFMHFRNCSGEPNRLPRAYHSGETGDIAHLIGTLHQREPDTTLTAVGVSLGGNALLKYLGEHGTNTPLQKAIAVSVPFRLDRAADRMERGMSRLYQWHLLRHLRAHTREKFRHMRSPIDLAQLDAMTTFRRFDDQVTAPLHGFADVDDYYRRSSSRPFLRDIRIPTLILHAEDDPFMTPDAIPLEPELSPSVTLELSRHGGHVGFVAAGTNRYWADRRIVRFLNDSR
ncbi:MAG: hydrolase [Gammaproteobacteria bacterium]|nr:hydrolase [Gammaproteobacteria bacterium]MCP5135629.1 hydrolase [Gammaproteobacteria bacterium]